MWPGSGGCRRCERETLGERPFGSSGLTWWVSIESRATMRWWHAADPGQALGLVVGCLVAAACIAY